jgi:hypothetical protein
MNNAEMFLLEKERMKCALPYTTVQMVYMPVNQKETEQFKEKWRRYKSVDEVRLKKYLHLQGADIFPDKESTRKRKLNHSCILPWRQMSISWEGILSLCCRDYYFSEVIGNTNNMSIRDLLNSDKMLHYRRLLASGNKNGIALCQNCAGFYPNLLAQIASAIFDGLTIRKLLPLSEKLALKFGIKLADYD